MPVGGFYTMDIEQAIIASEYLKPKKIIPMHYNTFDPIKADPERLKDKINSELIILKPGDSIEI